MFGPYPLPFENHVTSSLYCPPRNSSPTCGGGTTQGWQNASCPMKKPSSSLPSSYKCQFSVPVPSLYLFYTGLPLAYSSRDPPPSLGCLVLSSVSNLRIPPRLHHGISLRVSQFPLCPPASMCLHQCSSPDPICARIHCSVCSLPCPDPAAWPPRSNVSPLCSHRPTIRPAPNHVKC